VGFSPKIHTPPPVTAYQTSTGAPEHAEGELQPSTEPAEYWHHHSRLLQHLERALINDVRSLSMQRRFSMAPASRRREEGMGGLS